MERVKLEDRNLNYMSNSFSANKAEKRLDEINMRYINDISI